MRGDEMKTIRVAAAIIIENGKVFATQRGYGEFKDGWEFPGGKIEPDETPEAAIVREIREELDTEVEVVELLDTVEYDYPKFHLSMDCFICKIRSGDLVLKEHEAAKWLTKETLGSVEWLPADLGLVEKIGVYMAE
jgi:8-oxo-dGTP diphosphatase